MTAQATLDFTGTQLKDAGIASVETTQQIGSSTRLRLSNLWRELAGSSHQMTSTPGCSTCLTIQTRSGQHFAGRNWRG